MSTVEKVCVAWIVTSYAAGILGSWGVPYVWGLRVDRTPSDPARGRSR